MVLVVFNSDRLWSGNFSRLSDLVTASGFGCFWEISSGFSRKVILLS